MAKKKTIKKPKTADLTAKTAVDGITSEDIEALTGANAGVSGPGEIVAECAEQSEGHGEPEKTSEKQVKAERSKEDNEILAKLEEVYNHYADNPPEKVFNVYRCRSCLHSFSTKDVDPGVTPSMTECKNTGCGGDAMSQFYNTGQNREKWDYEWYRPEDVLEHLKGNRQDEDHLVNGGLLLRKVGGVS